MSDRQILAREIETLPAELIGEVLRYVAAIKRDETPLADGLKIEEERALDEAGKRFLRSGIESDTAIITRRNSRKPPRSKL